MLPREVVGMNKSASGEVHSALNSPKGLDTALCNNVPLQIRKLFILIADPIYDLLGVSSH